MYSENKINLNSFINYFVFDIVLILCFYFIKKIIDSIINGQPFCKNNINYFKYTGYSLLFLAVVDFIVNIHNFTGNVVLSFPPYFTFKISFFIFLSFAFLSLILSEVFSEAYQVKKENELTI